VYDLMELEHAYAPPFSSAKDPVAVVGYVAGNILSGKMNPLYWREMQAADTTKVTLVDVRTPDEFSLGSIPGAINVPLDDLRERYREIPEDKPVYVFCGVGLRGYLASNILKGLGYKKVRNLIGGLKTYKAAVTPVCLPDADNGCDEAGTSACACSVAADAQTQVVKVDACGIQCPGPILKLKSTMDGLKPGERLEIRATDAGFPRDAEAWCRTTGNKFLSTKAEAGFYKVLVEKSTPCSAEAVKPVAGSDGKTFIMFSDDLDKALATFVLANGAAATGKKVSIFFTFWGLNVIKKVAKPNVKKDIFGKMFGWMLPSDSQHLKLSKMNMGGMGAKMMRFLMNRKGVDSLEQLRAQAIANGVEFIACQMSMDVMGVKREELLDNVTVGGVATYMERAEQANLNLFI
ncbi:MAG: DsrE/DsrF/DrsH-like family protein, partial [Phocaeicola sp.]|nr:DsrE/DsrF/DrsH-like family protein [Phocaeicola sp.]